MHLHQPTTAFWGSPDRQLSEIAQLLLLHALDPHGLVAVGVAFAAPTRRHPALTELWLRPIDTAEDLVGFRAPGHWLMFGVVAPGHARATPGATPGEPTASAIAHVQHRSGASITLVDRGDQHRIEHGDPSGPLVELCRAVLAPGPAAS